MQDSKPKSLEWLRNRDASEIIEIDIEGCNPSELLVENTTSYHDASIKSQLDQLFSKLPKSLPKTSKSAESLCVESVESLPDWKALCKEVQITSKESFDWLKCIDADAETTGIIEASQGIQSNLPSRGVYSGMIYWACENLSENDWMPALRSIYYMFANKKAEWFYVVFKRVYSVFTRENNKPVVFISNPTPQLVSNLRKALVNIPQEETENENLVKVKKKQAMIKIEGKSVQAFYTYLVNNFVDTKIIAPCVFLNGQVKSLNPTCNGEIFSPFETPQKMYRLGLAGIITRPMIICLCKVFERTQNTFTLELCAESNSENFPGNMPKKIYKNSQNLYDITN